MLIKTEETGLGYLCLDHRASTELPPGITNRLAEYDTYTCSHCQRVVVMNPERKRERYKCRGCNHLTCDNCAAERAAGGSCKTFSQVIDEYLAQAERQTEASRIILP